MVVFIRISMLVFILMSIFIIIFTLSLKPHLKTPSFQTVLASMISVGKSSLHRARVNSSVLPQDVSFVPRLCFGPDLFIYKYDYVHISIAVCMCINIYIYIYLRVQTPACVYSETSPTTLNIDCSLRGARIVYASQQFGKLVHA